MGIQGVQTAFDFENAADVSSEKEGGIICFSPILIVLKHLVRMENARRRVLGDAKRLGLLTQKRLSSFHSFLTGCEVA